MDSIRRQIGNVLERLLDGRVLSRGQIGIAFEEEHLARFLAHFKVDCVFDVGANRGQYAEMLRKRVGFRGAIISFEPNGALAKELERRAASSDTWIIRNVALGKENGRATLNIMHDNLFSSLREPIHNESDLFRNANRVVRKEEVEMSTIAREMELLEGRIDIRRPFLKMDTQGNDIDVVKGCGEWIGKFVGLQSELSIKRLYAGATNYIEAIRFYESLGFELSAFVPNNAGHFPRLIEMDCIMFKTDQVSPSGVCRK